MVKIKPEVDPLICPLCQQKNLCANLGAKDINKTCWCHNTDITFPEALLDQIPSSHRGKACICESCAKGGVQDGKVNIFNPK